MQTTGMGMALSRPCALAFSCIAFLSFAEADQAATDADHVSRTQPPRAVDTLIIDPRPPCRSLIAQYILAALILDPGVDLVHRWVAEQAEVAALGPTYGHFRPRQQQFPSSTKPRFNLEPCFLQDHLRQTDQQPNTHAQGHKTRGRGTPQGID